MFDSELVGANDNHFWGQVSPITAYCNRDAIYVLDVFQKKSKRGAETPKQDMGRLRARLKLAKELAKNE